MRGEAEDAVETFPVVALGASAGGLAALTAFFDAVDAIGGAPNAAFIVLPHLSPHEKSRMADILQTHVALPVQEVDKPMRIEADRVYVLPADRSLTIVDGHVEPRPRGSDVPPHPVDDLFLALGPRYGPRAVAVVLSGTGSNGSFGLGAVKEHGGLVLAQAPDTADFSDMPRHAIETGLVDHVLAPADMPATILAYARHVPPDAADETTAEATPPGEPAPREDGSGYEAILDVLRNRAGIDLRQYKPGTLTRRIDRRVALHRLAGRADYVALLRDSHEERDALVSDLLITVTAFFRDPAAWTVLREEVIGPLVASHPEDETIRAWVAGCASGEEAYSLAMLLFEAVEAAGRPLGVEIFATDAAMPALVRARQGCYPAAAVEHLSDAQKDRFFRVAGDSVRVRHELREAIIFAPQNLVQDPPFSRVDIVVCRNVLIYLQPQLQHKLTRLFHFSLKDGGYLFLGPAETIGQSSDLFEPVSNKHRIFRRRNVSVREPLEFPVGLGTGMRMPPIDDILRRHQTGPAPRRPTGNAERVASALAGIYGPPAILVDRDLHALYYHGATDRYLKPQAGEPTQDLSVLLRDGLGLRLRRAAEEARESGRAEAGTARITLGDGAVRVRVEVTPLTDEADDGRLLVSFLEEGELAGTAQATAESTDRERELEAEVAQLRDDLRRTLEASQRGQEDLKAYNEEVMSMNEELRSANEEMETSKEELQSLNEELSTVNSQLRAKVDELHERTDDLNNLLTSTDVATLFLDASFNIRWHSPGIGDIFNIRTADTGRPISDLVSHCDDPALLEDARSVLQRLVPAERQVTSQTDHVFQRRIVPYRTQDDRIDGVVVTYTDVTEIQNARAYAERIVETVPLPFVVLDEGLRVVSANPAFYETFQVKPEETENRLIYDLGNGQWNIPALRRLLTDVLPHDKVFIRYEVTHRFETVGEKVMLLNGRRLDHVQLILLAIEDITEERRARRALEGSEERLRALVSATNYAIYRMSPDWSQMLELGGQGFIADTRRPSDRWMDDWIHPDDRAMVQRGIREAVAERRPFDLEHRVLRPDGTTAWTRSPAVPLLDEDGEIREWFGAASDVTDRKTAEEERALLLGELDHRVKNLFAVVRALASQGDVDRSAEEYRADFLARLDALLRAQQLALGRDWQAIDLATLAEASFAPFRGSEDRIRIAGEAVTLDARRAVSLSLVFHELATNAVKHGSLSTMEGTVELTWRVGRASGTSSLFIDWAERDGPEVSPPARKSFGLRMIERLFRNDFGGETDLAFHPEGLHLSARLPL